MDTSEAARWYLDSPRGDSLDAGGRVRKMLESTEAALRRSASLLHASGHEDRAYRVERFAAWARFDLDEPQMARQLYVAAARLRSVRQLEPLAGQALETVLSLARADLGNVQLADPVSGALRIVAQHGFGAEFLDYFAVVDDNQSACGRAARRAAQLVIADVVTDRVSGRTGRSPLPRVSARSSRRRWWTRRGAWSAWCLLITRAPMLRRPETCGS